MVAKPLWERNFHGFCEISIEFDITGPHFARQKKKIIATKLIHFNPIEIDQFVYNDSCNSQTATHCQPKRIYFNDVFRFRKCKCANFPHDWQLVFIQYRLENH